MPLKVSKHICIEIKSIPHSDHRYSTLGDYYTEFGVDHILVSRMSDWRYEFLIAIHELVEFYLCKKDGIDEKIITEFDLHSTDNEPGDNPKAPYHKQHKQASKIEKIVGKMMGINLEKYYHEIDDMFDPPIFKKRPV